MTSLLNSCARSDVGDEEVSELIVRMPEPTDDTEGTGEVVSTVVVLTCGRMDDADRCC